MDNASYHSVREEGTKTPTSNSRKGDMINWLTKNNINFNNKAKKPEIYGIVKLNKGPPIYKVDEFLKRKGHEILRLPPYHCELNPIELIWGDLKGFVGHDNSTFKGEDVKTLINKGFTQIDSVKWLHACEQVKHSIEQMIWKSDAIQEEIEEIIINLDSDSDSDSDEMSDQTDNETEDYEWP